MRLRALIVKKREYLREYGVDIESSSSLLTTRRIYEQISRFQYFIEIHILQ